VPSGRRKSARQRREQLSSKVMWQSYGNITPPPRSYSLFISHAWSYRDDYDGVVRLLNSDSTFLWRNVSVPAENPLSFLRGLSKSYRFLVRQIDERIESADCVLVLAGMYVAHRGWIQSEIEAALDFRKPIIAIEPRGQQRFPDALSCAHERVGWNTKAMVSAIRRQMGEPPLIQPMFPF